MKICYCIEGLYNSRGTERVLTQCANILSDYLHITIVTAFQSGRKDYYPLKSNINRIDLGVNDYKFNSVFFNPRKRDYKRKLSSFLIKEKFDIVISTGGLDSQFLYKIKDGSKKILWFHFAFDVSNLFIREKHKGIIADLMVWLQTKRRVYFANKMDKVVVLSQSDCKKWQKYCNNVTFIYNPITISTTGTSSCETKSIIAVGVLGAQKGFDYLIEAWTEVYQKHPDWQLDIFGEGPDREVLQNQINQYGLKDHVFLRGRTNNIESEYLSHSIYVMSSRAEGFGLVLVEAESCGLPLISYNCNHGPSEIITNNENGMLIDKVGDIKELSNAINYLIENPEERKRMGKRGKEMSKRFEGENIKSEWLRLFNELTNVFGRFIIN